jgi:hypothetical protein
MNARHEQKLQLLFWPLVIKTVEGLFSASNSSPLDTIPQQRRQKFSNEEEILELVLLSVAIEHSNVVSAYQGVHYPIDLTRDINDLKKRVKLCAPSITTQTHHALWRTQVNLTGVTSYLLR